LTDISKDKKVNYNFKFILKEWHTATNIM
jgi:hypothetical protein